MPITKPAQRCTYNTETVHINRNEMPNRQKKSVSDVDDIIVVVVEFLTSQLQLETCTYPGICNQQDWAQWSYLL